MSRKGKLPISLPKEVEIKIANNEVSVTGPKGTVHQKVIVGVTVAVEDEQIVVGLAEGHEDKGNFHGLFRSLIQNMVIGVTSGFEKKLEMIGVGYRASVVGDKLHLQIGFSHPTHIPISNEIQVKVDKNTLITVTGTNKHTVGQFAATVRAIRPPEPYQGKGIRYSGEYVRKKAGKATSKK